MPCDRISAEWGAQRIKGLSVKKAILHFLRTLVRPSNDIRQKSTETSLIEQFMYPRLGPGQLWETVAKEVIALGGKIVTDFDVDELSIQGDRVLRASGIDSGGSRRDFAGDYVFSTMPVKDLLNAFHPGAPEAVRKISNSLQYRDFITVGLLVSQLVVRDEASPNGLIKDNWIYIQEPEVKAGRLQIFNNWSPYMVADAKTVWIGVEYFCNQGDALWNLADDEMAALAKDGAGDNRHDLPPGCVGFNRNSHGKGVPGIFRQLPTISRTAHIPRRVHESVLDWA